MLGFSVSILALFAMILAIGLVVDDAIVVLENIQRLRAQGLSRAEAVRARAPIKVEFRGHRHHGGADLRLRRVRQLPGGEIGKLFGEFGIVLAVSVAVSGFVALTLSPVWPNA
ncbi:MAG: efflux RND transporter permease subunit [Paracoccaceae bacterium]